MVHKTAVVDDSARIAQTALIGPWCQVGPNVEVGEGTVLMQGVVILENTVLGRGNTVYPYSVLGGSPQDLVCDGDGTLLTIGNDNVIREYVTINRGTKKEYSKTIIGNNNYIMCNSHIGHDARLGNWSVIASYAGIAGHCRIGDYVRISGMVGIKQFVCIGDYSFISGKSAVEAHVPPYSYVYGTNATSSLKGANVVGLKRAGFKKDHILLMSKIIRKKSLLNKINFLSSKIVADNQHIEIVKNFTEFVRQYNKTM